MNQKWVECCLDIIITIRAGEALFPVTIRSIEESGQRFNKLIVVPYSQEDLEVIRDTIVDPELLEKTLTLEARHDSIYRAINRALDASLSSHYIVLTCGDEIIEPISIPARAIQHDLRIRYIPSQPYGTQSRGSATLNDCILRFKRAVKWGIPHCHNATVFIRDRQRYDLRYAIAADADYVFRRDRAFANSATGKIRVCFDGLSSKRWFRREIENFYIATKTNIARVRGSLT